MKAQASQRVLKAFLAGAMLLGVMAAPSAAQQRSARRAGEISALIPVDSVMRQKKSIEATKGMALEWGDKVVTERGGRVRIKLDDNSILNVGSQSQMTILQHDATTQRTDIQLALGRMRATVVRIANPAQGGFQVRTQAAVAGVVGTDVFYDAAEVFTTVIALGGGLVNVNGAACTSPVLLNPGEAVTMLTDRCGVKRLASEEELGGAYADTEVGEVAALAPKYVAPGASVQAMMFGKNVEGATAIAFAREGISAALGASNAPRSIPVNISVGANVPKGSYPFTVQTPDGERGGLLIVMTEEDAKKAAAGAVRIPEIASITAIRGAKFAFDASSTQSAPGTQIIAYYWRVIGSELASTESQFTVNTSFLSPGEHKVELLVVNNLGQMATARYTVTVDAGVQPQEIVRDLATGYESLQPNLFLKWFDDQEFRNYAGFAASIEDSFRNQLESVRVFQRPVNCTINEIGDEAVCQADYEVRFTKKDQPLEFLDSQGNPFPPGVPAPLGTQLGKRLLTGSERATLRFGRVNKGWRVVDYGAEVSCPGGNATTGVNVGSCILAIGSFSTPGFQITNLTLPTTDLTLGGQVSGTFDVTPLGGFNGSIDFAANASVLGSPVRVVFSPNPSPSLGTVNFTVFSPAQVPAGITGADPVLVTVTGTDSSGSVTQQLNFVLTLKGDFTLNVTPATTAGTPIQTAQGAQLTFTVQVIPGTGFTGSVTLDFANLPAGFTPISSNITVPAGGTAVLSVAIAQGSPLGPQTINIRGTFGSLVKLSPVFLDVSALPPFTVTQFSTATGPVTLLANASVVVPITVRQNIAGFTTPVAISFGPLPAGLTVNPAGPINVNPGATQNFTFTYVPAANPFANFGVTNITVNALAAGVPPQSSTIVLNLSSATALPFTINAAGTSTVTLPVTTSTSFNLSVSSQSTFNQPINITVGATPAGISISPGTFVFTPGISGTNVNYTVTVNPSVAQPGTFNIPIAAVSGGVSSTTTRTLNVFSQFSIALRNPNTIVTPAVIVPDGVTITPVIVDITSQSNFAGSVTVNFSNPFGGAVVVQPATSQTVNVTAGGTASVTFNLIGQTGAVNTAVTSAFISASSTTGSAANSISGPFLTIGPAGFTLSSVSAARTLDINQGGSQSVSTQVRALGNFTGNVDFVVVPTSVPAGVTVSPATQTVAANGTATFNLQANSPAQSGTFAVVVNASVGGAAAPQTFTINLTLRGGMTLNITRSPGGGVPGTFTLPLVLTPGTSQDFDIAVNPTNGYNGAASLFIFGSLPAGVTATFRSTGTVNGTIASVPGTDLLTLTASSTVSQSTVAQISVEAFDPTGQFSNSFPIQDIFISTGNPAFVLSCDNFGTPIPCSSLVSRLSSININQPGSTGSLSLRVDGQAGYSGTVQVVPQNLPAGVTMSPNPVLLTPGQSSVPVSFSAVSPATAGTFNFTLVGTDTVNSQLVSSTPGQGVLRGSILLTASPNTTANTPLIVQPGTSQTIQLDISGQNGFSGSANISSSFSVPTGVTISPLGTQAVTVPASGSVTLTYTITAAASTPASNILGYSWNSVGFDSQGNTSTFAVSGQSSISGAYVVGPSTFNVSVSGATLNNPLFLPIGQQRSMFISVNSIGNFVGTINLNVTGLPATIQVSSAPGSSATIPIQAGLMPIVIDPLTNVNTGGQGTSLSIFFTALTGAPRGFIQGNITATAGAIVQSIPIALFVVPQITMSLTPASTTSAPLAIAPGGSAQLQVAVAANPAFAGDADLTFNLPAGVTVTPTSGRVSIGSFTTLTVSVASTVAANTPLSLSINAAINGSNVASQAVNIFTGAGAFNAAVTPATALSSATPLVINAGSSGTVGVAITGVGGFSASVNVTVSFSVASLSTPTGSQNVTPGQTANFTVNAAAGAQGLTARMFITATSGTQSASSTVFISIGSGGYSLSTSTGASAASPLLISSGSSGNFNVLVHQQSGFSGSVTLNVSNLPTGFTINNNGAQTVPGSSQTMNLSTAPTVQAGDYQVTVTGTSPGLTDVVITVFVRVRASMTIAVSPGATAATPLVVAPGGQQTFTVSVNAGSTFFGSVSVGLSGVLPTGVTITPATATASIGSPAQFTMNVAAGTAAAPVSTAFFNASGTYAIQSVNGSLNYTIAGQGVSTFNLNVTSSLALQINNSNGNTLGVSVQPVGGYSGNVTVTFAGFPTGVTASPAQFTQQVSGTGSNTSVRFVAASNAAPGLRTITVTATDGTITVGPVNVDLIVLADFSLTISPTTTFATPVTVLPGAAALRYQITMQPLDNFAACASGSTVNLSVGSLPQGVTAALPASVTAGGTVNLDISAAAGTAASGLFGVDVFGTAADQNCSQSFQSVSVFAVIGPGGFAIQAGGQPTVSIGTGSFSTAQVQILSVGNFTGTVTVAVTASSVAAGVTVTPATAVVNAGTTHNFQVTAAPPATAGTGSFSFTVTDGTTTLNGTINYRLLGSYSLTISPANSQQSPAVVGPNQSVNYTVTVTPQNGFNGTVDINRNCFGCGSPPPGVSITTSLTASPGQPGTIAVSGAPTVVPSQPFAVFFQSTAADSSTAPSFNFFSAAGPATFVVSNTTSPTNPTSVVINGGTRNVTVTVRSLGAFSGTVDLAVGTPPTGLTSSPQNAQVFVPPGGQASFNFAITAGSSAVQGAADLVITASQGAAQVNSFVYLFVVSGMALQANPQSALGSELRIIPGDPVGQTVSIQVLNQGGFAGNVTLSTRNLPTGVTVTPNPNPPVIPAGGSATFQITAAANAPPGAFSFAIDAVFSGLSATSIVFINVGVGTFTLSSTPVFTSTNPLVVDPTSAAGVPLTMVVTPQNGFLGTVTITPTLLPSGVTTVPTSAQVTVNSAQPVSTSFTVIGSQALGSTPVASTWQGTATVPTPVTGPVTVQNSTNVALLVNPPVFALTQNGGTSASHISLEQGIPPGGTFQIGVTGLGGFTGSVTVSFTNVPNGITISPATVTLAPGGNATFNVVASGASAVGAFIIPVVGTAGSQSATLNLFVDVVQPTSGIFITTSPPTTAAAPLLLQADHLLTTFLNVNVNSKGSFAGTVTLALTGVPAGVTATLVPTIADLSATPVQVVLLNFQTTTGLAPFAPMAVTVTGTSGSVTSSTFIFTALQVTSAIAVPGGPQAALSMPSVTAARPSAGMPGTYVQMRVTGQSLGTVQQVMSSTPMLVPRLEPGATDNEVHITVFVRPNADAGAHSLMLLTQRGAVTVGFTVGEVAEPWDPGDAGKGRRVTGRGVVRSPAALRAANGGANPFGVMVTRIEPARLNPGDVVEGRLYGENLSQLSGVRVNGLGIAVEILDKTDTEVRVKFIASASAASGTRLLTLETAGQPASTAYMQVGATSRVPVQSTYALANPGVAGDSSSALRPNARRAIRGDVADAAAPPAAGSLDLAIRAEDIIMSPASPKAGEQVTFRIRMKNESAQRVEDVEVEFSIGGTPVKARDRFTFEPFGTQSLQVEWTAQGSGRLEPKVVIDPDNRVADANRSNNLARLAAFEVAAAAPGGSGLTGAAVPGAKPALAPKERGQLTLIPGTCQGFRLSSGTEQTCGGGEFEVSLAAQGGAMRIEAEGIRNLGSVGLDQTAPAGGASLGSAESLQAGNTYLVKTSRGMVLVRVAEVRGLESARNYNAALSRPSINRGEREPVTPAARVTVVLEYRALQ